MIAIPTSFQLGGRTWQVIYVDNVGNETDCYGDCDGDSCIIRLKAGLAPEFLQHTFYHELVHAWCFTLGWGKMNEDEDKVDSLSSVLLQFLKSKRGRLQ